MPVQESSLLSSNRGGVLGTAAGSLLLLYILSLGIMQPGIRVLGFAVQASEAIFLALFPITLLAAWSDRQRPAKFPLIFPFAAYLLAFFLAAIFSVDQRLSSAKFVGVAYLVLLAACVPLVVRDVRWLRFATLAFVFAAVIVGWIGAATVVIFYLDRDSALIAPFLHHYGSLPPGNYPRIESTFIYPSMLCNYLTVGAMLALGSNQKGWLSNRWTLTALVPITVTALFTFTPGFGGFVLALMAWAALKFNSFGRRMWAFLAMISGLVAAIASLAVSAFTFRQIPTSPYRFSLAGMTIDPTQRFLTWEGAWRTFLEYPLFGKGIGTWAAQVYFLSPSGQMQLLVDAHNTFLNIAATAGILGVAAMTYLAVRVLKAGTVTAIISKPITAALTIAFLSAFVFQGMTGSYEDARHLWLVIGLIPAAAAIESMSPENIDS